EVLEEAQAENKREGSRTKRQAIGSDPGWVDVRDAVSGGVTAHAREHPGRHVAAREAAHPGGHAHGDASDTGVQVEPQLSGPFADRVEEEPGLPGVIRLVHGGGLAQAQHGGELITQLVSRAAPVRRGQRGVVRAPLGPGHDRVHAPLWTIEPGDPTMGPATTRAPGSDAREPRSNPEGTRCPSLQISSATPRSSACDAPSSYDQPKSFNSVLIPAVPSYAPTTVV